MNAVNPSENHIVVFNDRTIRKMAVDDLWWFSIADVIQSLIDSTYQTQETIGTKCKFE